MTTTDDLSDFTVEIADQVESFLVALQAIARDEEGGSAVPLLLLEVSQLLLAGARLGAQADFTPDSEYQPDVGPDPDLDAMRLRLADELGGIDTYALNFEPYDPETVPSQISDDVTAIAAEVANGLRHFRQGDVLEALWWWQYSYLASWGTAACGVQADASALKRMRPSSRQIQLRPTSICTRVRHSKSEGSRA